eukprot:1156647-Pelagomonas_calceolata.AAC.2
MYVIRNMISHICFILAGQLSPALLTASTCREMLALGAHVRWCNDMAPAPETHVYRAGCDYYGACARHKFIWSTTLSACSTHTCAQL